MKSRKKKDHGLRFPLMALLLTVALGALILAAVSWGVRNEERDLTGRAEAVLAGTDLDVEFEGRYAVLAGFVSNQLALDEAAASVEELRGVHSINTDAVLIATEAVDNGAGPGVAHVDAVVRADAITLSGVVPDQAAVDAIVAAAEERFGADSVINELLVNPDVSAPEWLATVPGVLRVMDGFTEGGVGFSGTEVLIAGIVDSAPARANLVDAVTAAVGDTATVEYQLLVVVVDPPTLGAVFDQGTLTLRGLLPDESLVDDIAAAAEASFGAANVDDRLTAGDSVGSPPYLESIPGIFADLAQLDAWTITLQDDVITIWGRGSAEAVSTADAALAGLVAEDLEVIVDLEDNNSSIASFLTELLSGSSNFETGSAVLSAEAKDLLDVAIDVLLDNPNAELVVEGHTDNVGDAQFNLALSEARAQAVVDYLVAGGVSADRLSAIGFGESDPIANNSTEEGRAQNRRIEFVIQEGDG